MHSHGKSGFSLVELTVVLIILGLMVGGILAGRNLIYASEVNRTITDIQAHVAAYHAFKLKYNCIPGDCHNIRDYFPGSNIYNGDGNGLINCKSGDGATCDAPTSEHGMALRALQASGLLPGESSGTATRMKVPLRKCELEFFQADLFKQPLQNVVRVYDSQEVAPWNNDCMTPGEAESIDRKLDDGNPSSGKVFGIRFVGNPQSPCVNVNHWQESSASAAYNVNQKDVACSIFYGLGRL